MGYRITDMLPLWETVRKKHCRSSGEHPHIGMWRKTRSQGVSWILRAVSYYAGEWRENEWSEWNVVVPIWGRCLTCRLLEQPAEAVRIFISAYFDIIFISESDYFSVATLIFSSFQSDKNTRQHLWMAEYMRCLPPGKLLQKIFERECSADTERYYEIADIKPWCSLPIRL